MVSGVGHTRNTGHHNPALTAGVRGQTEALDGLRLVGQFDLSTAKKSYIGDGWQWHVEGSIEPRILRFGRHTVYAGLGADIVQARTSQYKKLQRHWVLKAGVILEDATGRTDLSYGYKTKDDSINHSDSHNFNVRHDLPKMIGSFIPGIEADLSVSRFDQQPFPYRLAGQRLWLKFYLSKALD
ncbi:MAG TPA: hypothetical protein VF747_07120 [Blastocatellia bacterium]|jgi:hypothetical protein